MLVALCVLFSSAEVLADQVVMRTSKGEVSFAMSSNIYDPSISIDPNISIDWGDETTSDGADGRGDGYTLKFSHRYGDEKLHTIVVRASSLKKLYCGGNQLTGLDINRCLDLEILDCSDNQLTSLHVSFHPRSELEELYVNDNQLTSLDIMGCRHLEILNCANNQLTRLDDVWRIPKLEKLYCNGNQLETIDLWGNDKLMFLYIENNQLPELYLDHCTELIELSCGKNPLQSLDLSKCRLLYRLDVSGCRLLEKLICRSNVEVKSESCYTLQIQSPPKIVETEIDVIDED
jgi:Leucine-rich repeat (LRR) protein